PLMLVAHPADTLRLRWAWDGAVIDQAQVERLAVHFEALLEQLASDATQPVGILGVLPPPSPRVRPDYDFRSLTDRIAEQTATCPNAIAIADGDMRLTYA